MNRLIAKMDSFDKKMDSLDKKMDSLLKDHTSRMNKNRNPIDGANMHKSNILFVKIHKSEIPIYKSEKIDCLYLINLSKFSHQSESYSW